MSDYTAAIPKFITPILSDKAPIVYGNGRQTRDFTYVKDVEQANFKAMMSNAGGIFNVASNRRIDLIELSSPIMDKLDAHFQLKKQNCQARRCQRFAGRYFSSKKCIWI